MNTPIMGAREKWVRDLLKWRDVCDQSPEEFRELKGQSMSILSIINMRLGGRQKLGEGQNRPGSSTKTA